MNIYTPAQNVVISFAHADEAGVAFTPSAASYRVVDETEAEIVGWTNLPGPSGDSTSVTVTGAQNTLAGAAKRGYRLVEVRFTIPSGVVRLSEAYILESTFELVVMGNSYQTIGEAELLAMDLSLDAWSAKTVRERKAALTEAYNRLGTMGYQIRLGHDQDRVSPYAWNDDYIGYDGDFYRRIAHINEFTKDEFLALPAVFRMALRRAQIVEADEILSGSGLTAKRREGLMSETIGESSQMFRPGKPLIMSVSRKALLELKGFISHSVSIGRA